MWKAGCEWWELVVGDEVLSLRICEKSELAVVSKSGVTTFVKVPGGEEYVTEGEMRRRLEVDHYKKAGSGKRDRTTDRGI